MKNFSVSPGQTPNHSLIPTAHDPSFLSFPSTSNVASSSQLASAGLRPDYQSSSDQMSTKKTFVKKRTKPRRRMRGELG